MLILSTSIVKAECVPYPPCDSIGYTETSCETQAVKCPFDATKLYCLPCDTKYKYTCDGDNIIGGIGNTCNGKYASSECSGGGEFNNGICSQSCTVGMIYYSDKSCSNDLDSTKTAIGVVVKDNELVLSQKSSSTMTWASNTSTNTSLTNYSSAADAKTDFNGKSNTAVIVAAYSNDTASNNAAIYCDTYTTAGTSTGDWYLPAAGELYSYVYGNYSAINTAMTTIGWTFGSVLLLSSSESFAYAWSVNSSDGDMDDFLKDGIGPVTCFLTIN